MIRFPYIRTFLFLTMAAFAAWSQVAAAEAEPPLKLQEMDREPTPAVLPASNAGDIALKLFQLPEGLEASLWAAEPMLANPVGINFDNQGRLYVAETYRYRTSTLDIRDYMPMLEDDLDNRTIEDRLESIRRQFGEVGLNDLSIEGELVRKLEDRDADGVADHTVVYADGFDSALDGIGADVLPGNDGVYFTNIPSLWFFTGEEKAETREEMFRGFGIRFGYTGHDLHGLTWGPDGKLYFSVGDRGAHIETKDGRTVNSQDRGCVFRCNPDGTELEIVHWGLRNPQDLFFTENGDLFTGDNDSDQGDIERLVQIVEGGDSGWRIGYQFAPMGDTGPWNGEGVWFPRHERQPANVVPPVCLIEDGPSGVAYYPGTGLSPDYQGTIFITTFVGSVARSGIQAYRIEEDGATYRPVSQETFLGNALPTDIAWGPDGRFYYSDWAEGWPKSKRGRIYAIDDPRFKNGPLRLETQRYLGEGMGKRRLEELAKLIGHADQRVRLEAQFELARRGEASAPVFAAVASSADGPRYGRFHAIWGLGQLAHAKITGVLEPLMPLLGDPDSEVRAQAAKVLGDYAYVAAGDRLFELLRDESARVRFFAAQSLGKLGNPEAAVALIETLRANNDADPYLRHACVLALARLNNSGVFESAATDESNAVRLGVLLALRRRGDPAISRFLKDDNAFIVAEAARAINDEPIIDAYPALAALLKRPVDDEWLMLRAVNAAFRIGTPAQAKALADFATRTEVSSRLRAEAVGQLARWPKPPQRDRIVGIYRPLAESTRDITPARDAIGGVVAKLLSSGTSEEVQTEVFAAIRALELRSSADELFTTVGDETQTGSVRAAALEALDQFDDPRIGEAISIAGASDSPALRLAALPVAAKVSADAVLPVLETLATQGNTTEQRTAYEALAKMEDPAADRIFAERLRALKAGGVAPGAQIELLEAAAQREDSTVKKLLADREAAIAASGDLMKEFEPTLEGGDFSKGIRVFNNHPVMACQRCHQVLGTAPGAGPNLGLIGAKMTRRELLQAVLEPNATIAEGFESVVVSMKNGDVNVGSIASETDDVLSLRLLDGSVTELQKSEITKRDGAPSAMPAIYQHVLTKREIRDLIEFVSRLKTRFGFDSGPRAITPFAGPQRMPNFDSEEK